MVIPRGARRAGTWTRSGEVPFVAAPCQTELAQERLWPVGGGSGQQGALGGSGTTSGRESNPNGAPYWPLPLAQLGVAATSWVATTVPGIAGTPGSRPTLPGARQGVGLGFVNTFCDGGTEPTTGTGPRSAGLG